MKKEDLKVDERYQHKNIRQPFIVKYKGCDYYVAEFEDGSAGICNYTHLADYEIVKPKKKIYAYKYKDHITFSDKEFKHIHIFKYLYKRASDWDKIYDEVEG